MNYQVFVSYRRDGGEHLAGRLADKLKEKGFIAFYDIESMRSGTFNKQIYDAIDSCKDFLLVLPVGALDRCQNEGDWVRLEIAHALKKNKNIIPVMTNGFSFPKNLPADIEKVQYMQGVTASSEFFDAVVDRIIGLLVSKPKSAKPTKKCPVCGADNDMKNKVCSACGDSFVKPKPQNKPIKIWEPTEKKTGHSGNSRAFIKFVVVDALIAAVVLCAWFGYILPSLKKNSDDFSADSKTVENIAGESASPAIESDVSQEPDILHIDGNSFSGDLSLDGQVDKYTFTAPTSGKYNFAFDLSDANAELRFHIYNKKNTDLSGYKYSDTESTTVELTEGETYSIQIEQEYLFVAYTVNIGTPDPVQQIKGSVISGTIDFKDKADTYTYTAPSSGMYNFAFTLSDASAKIGFSLYNHKNASLTDSYYRDGENRSIELEEGQMYTAYVMYKSGFADYNINIATPNPVKTVNGNLILGNITYPKQTDQHLYTAPMSGRYNLSFELDGGASMSCSILTDDGKSVFSKDVKSGDYTVDLEKGNTYTICFMHRNSVTKYNVSIRTPNETKPVINNSISGKFDFEDQVNKYSYTADVDGVYGLSFSSGGHLDCRITDENGEAVYNERHYSSQSDTVTLKAGKTYTIEMYQVYGNEYSLNITPQKPTRTVGLGNFNGELTFSGQCDYYKFTAMPGGEHTFTINTSRPIPYFSLIDAGGKVLFTAKDRNDSEKAYLTEGMTYTLEVKQGTFLGEYSVTIEHCSSYQDS